MMPVIIQPNNMHYDYFSDFDLSGKQIFDELESSDNKNDL